MNELSIFKVTQSGSKDIGKGSFFGVNLNYRGLFGMLGLVNNHVVLAIKGCKGYIPSFGAESGRYFVLAGIALGTLGLGAFEVSRGDLGLLAFAWWLFLVLVVVVSTIGRWRHQPEDAPTPHVSAPSSHETDCAAVVLPATCEIDGYEILTELAYQSYDAHSVVLYIFDANLRCWVCAAAAGVAVQTIRVRVEGSVGLFGLLRGCDTPLVLDGLRPGYGGVVYYEKPLPVTTVALFPIVYEQQRWGVLVLDRKDGHVWSSEMRAGMAKISKHIGQLALLHRLCTGLGHEGMRKELFYQAGRRFSAARSATEVAEVLVEITHQMSSACLSLAIVPFVSEEGSSQAQWQIAAVQWDHHEESMKWVGKPLGGNGLAMAALKAGCVLPYGSSRRGERNILGRDMVVDVPFLKVLPLCWQDKMCGALVLGSDIEDVFHGDSWSMLQAVADHSAAALDNAGMLERMEWLASTDGLTGLLNHRSFHQELTVMLKRSKRYHRHFALMLVDIDHFKRINDQFGHPIGDQVLQEFAALLKAEIRQVDIVARYGGEEFAILLEESNKSGAYIFAERLRSRIASFSFGQTKTAIQVTASLGVVVFPDHGDQSIELITSADRALYHAKDGGRNRVVIGNRKSLAIRRNLDPQPFNSECA